MPRFNVYMRWGNSHKEFLTELDSELELAVYAKGYFGVTLRSDLFFHKPMPGCFIVAQSPLHVGNRDRILQAIEVEG